MSEKVIVWRGIYAIYEVSADIASCFSTEEQNIVMHWTLRHANIKTTVQGWKESTQKYMLHFVFLMGGYIFSATLLSK